MTRGRARAIFSHRAWTYATLICAATAFLALAYLDLLVALRVDCRIYKGPVTEVVQWIPLPAFYLAIPLLVLNVVRAFLIRSVPIGLLSFVLAGFGFWLFLFTFDHTFTYCWLDGADLPPCLLGCAK